MQDIRKIIRLHPDRDVTEGGGAEEAFALGTEILTAKNKYVNNENHSISYIFHS